MIPRYTHPDMGRIWSEERRFETWLQVEIAAAEAMAEAGIIPQDAARDIRERAAFDVQRIAAIEETTQHDVIAFTTAVAEHVGPSARWLHFGLTSSDVVDTAQAIQMRDATTLLLKGVDNLLDAVRSRAEEHRRTPMMGRTHGVHAEVMTFGLKLALWYAELRRDAERLARARAVVSAKSRSRLPRGRRARRRCRTSEIRSVASRSPASRGCCAETPTRHSKMLPCGTSATSHIRPSSA
jgi:adenylosuccinate lyase